VKFPTAFLILVLNVFTSNVKSLVVRAYVVNSFTVAFYTASKNYLFDNLSFFLYNLLPPHPNNLAPVETPFINDDPKV